MSHQDIIQTLIEWIDEHIDQPLNIDIVARKSGYSKWYLQRMFRTVMHQTLGDYIRQRRLLLAAEALRTTQRPIFDIAMDLATSRSKPSPGCSAASLTALPATIAIRSPRDAAAEARSRAREHWLTTA
ncbi:DNA-binding transcriptional regulator SoxS [Klebsiella pneumoniae subsp. pneumoniae KpMDU1]|nr:DNA-binding transcriptional regulator SoxS [Klebsiella pneumoniae subsp. pneumoniae KpMDU1]